MRHIKLDNTSIVIPGLRFYTREMVNDLIVELQEGREQVWHRAKLVDCDCNELQTKICPQGKQIGDNRCRIWKETKE